MLLLIFYDYNIDILLLFVSFFICILLLFAILLLFHFWNVTNAGQLAIDLSVNVWVAPQGNNR
jgi:hypothetical protein